MAASTPREVVVELDGLWFQLQSLRGRRAWRGKGALQVILGANGYLTVQQPIFWEAEFEKQYNTLTAMETAAGSSYGAVEQAMVELLAFSADTGGQGVCYRDTEPSCDEPNKGWVPVRSMDTLDSFPRVDHLTWEALRWEMIKLCYRPFSAAGGTSAATPSADTTSTRENSLSGKAKTPLNGTPKAETRPSGISGA